MSLGTGVLSKLKIFRWREPFASGSDTKNARKDRNWQDNLSIVQTLLKCGLDVDARDANGFTALKKAWKLLKTPNFLRLFLLGPHSNWYPSGTSDLCLIHGSFLASG